MKSFIEKKIFRKRQKKNPHGDIKIGGGKKKKEKD